MLIIVSLLTFLAGSRIGLMRFDYDFEAFFPNEDKELDLYHQYRNLFEYDNEFILIGIENKEGIFRKDFLQQTHRLTDELSRLKNIRQVQSPTNLTRYSYGALIPIKEPVLHIDDEQRYVSDSAGIYSSGYLVGSFFPSDARSVTIFIKTEPGLSKKKSDRLSIEINNLLRKYTFDEVHVAGRIFAQKAYLTLLQKEFVLFISLSILVVIVFLWFTFRSLYAIIIPVCVVSISLIWTLGIMQLFGKPIDLMTTILPTMVFIAGTSDVVHFLSKYFEEMQKETPKAKVYKLILHEVGLPTFITLITTVVAFMSLLFSSIRPIREFGIYTSAGITIAFILSYTLLPALLNLFGPEKLLSRTDSHNKVHGGMQRLMFWIFRNQKTIVVTTLLLVVISIFGISRIKVNNILLEDLSSKTQIKRDFDFFDRHYSGARPLELLITVVDKNSSVWDPEILKQIARIEQFVKKEYNAGFLLSAPAAIREYNLATNGVTGDVFQSDEELQHIAEELKKNRKNKDLRRIISQDGKTTRISGKIKDIGSEKVNQMNEHLSEFVTNHVDTTKLQVTVTGAGHLIDRNNSYMVENMTQGFLFSVIVIGLLTYILHRSWRMVMVFLLPNLLPLVVISGIMGFAGIELKAATSLVFSIAFGIATDDTIHFISRLKIETGYGKSMLYAFKRTYFETGRPIILTGFILLGGFMSLMFSDFQSSFYFGLLICITLVIAVIADLFLLPVLLFLFYPGKKSNES